MKGVSRDGGTKQYTNKTVVLENDIATREIPTVFHIETTLHLKKM